MCLNKLISLSLSLSLSLCDDVENQSDHAPVVLSLNINIDLHVCAPINHIPRKKWNNASLDQIDSYKSVFNDKLSVIDMPNDCLNCENVLCNNNDHANLIQQMHDDILVISACIDASDNIPSTRNNNNKLPGWNEFVKREKETALFWRSIWINNGSPRQGYVADIMRRTLRSITICDKANQE